MLARHFGILDLSSGSAPGRAVTVEPGAQSTQLMDLRASDGAQAQLVTLNIQPTLSNLPADCWPALRATMEWGVHGGSHSCQADIDQGLQVTLAADFLRVSCAYPLVVPNRPAAGHGGGTAPVQLNVSAAYGTKPGAAGGLRLTEFLANVPINGTSAAVPIPPWTRAVSVNFVPDAGVSPFAVWANLRFFGGGASPITQMANVIQSQTEWGSIPVPRGARSIRVHNDAGSASPLADLSVTFYLSL